MRIVKSVAGMQWLALRWRRAGTRIGLVPTMGFLHAGHLSLVRAARRAVGARGKVVLSIFVNPTQFAPTEDFSRYPRDLTSDLRLCRAEGVDVVFAPSEREMYPAKTGEAFSTYVVEGDLSKGMEGASRPTHFRGVTTVVAKLFNIVQPDVAVFGAKDFPLRLIVAPIFREPDGLAMSSRNKYLEGDLRRQATVLSRSIQDVRTAIAGASRPLPSGRLRVWVKKLIEKEPSARLDYVEFFEPETLKPVQRVARGTHIALAVFVGKTRLIDNARL
jgi:pantoate--beta-alanine ligase